MGIRDLFQLSIRSKAVVTARGGSFDEFDRSVGGALLLGVGLRKPTQRGKRVLVPKRICPVPNTTWQRAISRPSPFRGQRGNQCIRKTVGELVAARWSARDACVLAQLSPERAIQTGMRSTPERSERKVVRLAGREASNKGSARRYGNRLKQALCRWNGWLTQPTWHRWMSRPRTRSPRSLR